MPQDEATRASRINRIGIIAFAIGLAALLLWSFAPILAVTLQSEGVFRYLSYGFYGIPLLEFDFRSNVATIISVVVFWLATIALSVLLFLPFRERRALVARGHFPTGAGLTLSLMSAVLAIATISTVSEMLGDWRRLSGMYRQAVPGDWAYAVKSSTTWAIFSLITLAAVPCYGFMCRRTEMWIRMRSFLRLLIAAALIVAAWSGIALYLYLSTSNFGSSSLVPAIEASSVGYYSGLALSVWVAVWAGGCYLRFTPLFGRLSSTALQVCPVCGYDLRASPKYCPECGVETGIGKNRKEE